MNRSIGLETGTPIYWKRFWSSVNGEGDFYTRMHLYKAGGITYCGRRVPEAMYHVGAETARVTCKACRKAAELTK